MERKIHLVVKSSGCDLYKEGDCIYFDGPRINKEKSANLCLPALSALFPFIYAARKGSMKTSTLQCPNCRESVEFILQKTEEG